MEKVSVIIPTYNTSDFVRESVDSVLHQTYQEKEVIVVDDGSTDDTRGALDDYVKGGQIKYFYQENKGPGAARNVGIKHSSGELIAFLDADDIWFPEKLEKQIKFFENKKIGLVYSDMEFFGDKFPFKTYSEMAGRFYGGRVLGKLLMRNFIPISSVIVRRSAIEKDGYFTEKNALFTIEDYELWLRLARNIVFDFIPESLVKYRIHRGQISKPYANTYKRLSSLYLTLLFTMNLLYAPLILAKYMENKMKYFIRKP